MLFSDLRVAVYLAFVMLVVWRGSIGIPEGYPPHVVGFAVLIAILRVMERALLARRLRADVGVLASMDPADAEHYIERLWSVGARRRYRALLAQEGSIEERAGVERFPYTRSARVAHDRLYWVAIGLAALAFAMLFGLRRHGAWIPWLLWAIGSAMMGAAAWARSRASEFASTLELTPFGVTRVSDRGTREGIRWRDDVLLQNQPRRKRLIIIAPRQGTVIALGYQRLGFTRLLRLTLEYGGFTPAPTEPDQHSTDA